jgi:hypothetical protein
MGSPQSTRSADVLCIRSLRAVFDYSWRRLPALEQRALARLWVFAGGFDRAAALAVAETRPATLAALVDKSLLRRLSAGRYSMHELLRQFAAEQLDTADAERGGGGTAQRLLPGIRGWPVPFLRCRGIIARAGAGARASLSGCAYLQAIDARRSARPSGAGRAAGFLRHRTGDNRKKPAGDHRLAGQGGARLLCSGLRQHEAWPYSCSREAYYFPNLGRSYR